MKIWWWYTKNAVKCMYVPPCFQKISGDITPDPWTGERGRGKSHPLPPTFDMNRHPWHVSQLLKDAPLPFIILKCISDYICCSWIYVARGITDCSQKVMEKSMMVMEKSWKSHGIWSVKFCGNPGVRTCRFFLLYIARIADFIKSLTFEV